MSTTYEGWAVAAVALLFGAGWAKSSAWALRRRALKKLDQFDLTRVVEVRNASSVLRAMAECQDVAALSSYLGRFDDRALHELWQAAHDEGAQPIGTDPQPRPQHWADAAVWAMGHMTVEATDRVAALEGSPPATPSRWQVARERFEVVEAEWEAIACDALAAIEHSALLDVTPGPGGRPTRSIVFFEAFGKAKDTLARLTATEDEPSPVDVELFEDQARAAETAWREAKRWSEHVGFGWMPEGEQSTAQTIHSCLTRAADDRLGVEERINAAEKAARLLKRIHSFVLPERSAQAIEQQVRGELTAGPSAGGPILAEQERSTPHTTRA